MLVAVALIAFGIWFANGLLFYIAIVLQSIRENTRRQVQ